MHLWWTVWLHATYLDYYYLSIVRCVILSHQTLLTKLTKLRESYNIYYSCVFRYSTSYCVLKVKLLIIFLFLYNIMYFVLTDRHICSCNVSYIVTPIDRIHNPQILVLSSVFPQSYYHSYLFGRYVTLFLTKGKVRRPVILPIHPIQYNCPVSTL